MIGMPSSGEEKISMDVQGRGHIRSDHLAISCTRDGEAGTLYLLLEPEYNSLSPEHPSSLVSYLLSNVPTQSHTFYQTTAFVPYLATRYTRLNWSAKADQSFDFNSDDGESYLLPVRVACANRSTVYEDLFFIL